MRFEFLDATSGKTTHPYHFQPLLAKIKGGQINITWLDTVISKLCSGCSLLFGGCIEDRKIQRGRRKETMAFQGTASWEARQMGLSVSWRIGLDLKISLIACRNVDGWWGGAGGSREQNSIGKTERCFFQAGRISFTTRGGK